MKSTYMSTRLALASALGLLSLGGAVNAQQRQVIISDDTSVKASIPIKNALLSPNGNVEVVCQQNPCPSIGGGTGSGSAPAINFTGPTTSIANPLPVGSTSVLNWTATSAELCFGVKSSPAVSAWGKGLASVNNFSLSQLQRDQTNTRTYDLTLRCYEAKAAPLLNSTGEAAYRDSTYSVTLAPSTSPEPEPGNDSCDTFYPVGSPARSQPGFSTGLTRIDVSFTSVYGMSFSSLLNQGGSATAALPGTYAGAGRFISIPLDVPANTPDNKGIYIAWVEPQGLEGVEEGSVEFSISPCAGDFRAPPSTATHSWDIAQCRKFLTGNGSVVLTTGSGGSTGSACRLPKGGRVYINMTLHDLSGHRATGAAPVSTCTGSAPCGKAFAVSEY